MEAMPASFCQKEWTFMIIQNRDFIFKYFFLLFLLLGTSVASSGQTRLHGKTPDYAGEMITFYTYSDYITKDTVHLETAEVLNDGTFSCMLNFEQVRKIFVNLGVYKGFFFAETGQKYELALPDKKKKSKAQKLNPYFKGIPVHIGIVNSGKKELNYKINKFSNFYDEIINKNVNNVKNLSRIKDSIYTLLDTKVQSEISFFQDYKAYTLGGLKLSLGYPVQKVKNNLLAGSEIRYHNPAYMDFISTLFSDYFKDLFSKYGNEIYYVINRLKSYSRLDSLIRRDSVLGRNEQLREMVLLKGLHDAYYDQSFSKQAVRHILDSTEHYIKYEENLVIANNIQEKNKTLSKGDQAPEFCLYDADSNRVCLNNFKGEYVYLGFCHSKNYSCIRHYNILENLYKKHKKHFKIVIISGKESFSQMKRFVDHHGYPWTFLHLGDHKNLLNKYRVKNMPAYFFINTEGKIELSPAPAPSENIEEKIYRVMKKDGAL